MAKNHINAISLLLLIFVMVGCKSSSSTTYSNKTDGIDFAHHSEKAWDAKAPYVLEEFRAAWIATVANISWPSKPGLSTEQQKEEALKLLEIGRASCRERVEISGGAGRLKMKIRRCGTAASVRWN